jgi:hypothetical protein
VGSSTEAEYASAYFISKMILFLRSILWDLNIPQEAATLLYEDNDACTAMANAQKPTPRTRHMDIKYFSLSEWVERDLMLLEHIDTSINLADHFTKGLQTALFHHHAEFILGHIPLVYLPATDQLLGLMPGVMNTWTTLSLHLLLPPSLLLQPKYMLLFHLIIQTILGSQILGMGSTIHLFPCLVV